jgi:hypothetical protein
MSTFPRHDVVGTALSEPVTAPSEDACRGLCCANATAASSSSPRCVGYAFSTFPFADGHLCILLSNVTSIVPSNIMNGAVVPEVLGS